MAFETGSVITAQENVFDVVTTTGIGRSGPSCPGRRRGHRAPLPAGRPHLRVLPHPRPARRNFVAHHRDDRPDTPSWSREDGTSITYTFIGKGDRHLLLRMFELGPVLGAQQTTPCTPGHREGREREVKGAGGEDPLARAEAPTCHKT